MKTAATLSTLALVLVLIAVPAAHGAPERDPEEVASGDSPPAGNEVSYTDVDEGKGPDLDTINKTTTKSGRGRRSISSSECVRYIQVDVHTSHAGGSGGATNYPHNVEIRIGSYSTYVARLYNPPDFFYPPSTTGTFGKWKLHINYDFGVPSWYCVRWTDIRSISLVASNNDGWLIDYVLTLLQGSYGGVRWFTGDSVYNGRWVDRDATFSMTGGLYDANRFPLTIRNFC